ncbi:TraB/GumN family protein [Duganella sp. CY15W]|uniref:TraB/GumN family protein n=1 Tax=Duganella sp. CY15W TaxID=2692172 RepID=UPI00136B39C8|nr:TraB/GumN family protein [Duganella sp. CY15W]MYM28438.1 TraB/GumN family protein [Duganella sp. CY15W]
MTKYLLPALCLSLSLSTAWAQTEAPPTEAEPAAAPGETVLLVGQRPGPGLWKVSKDGHVLWVFGSYGPLPEKMEWRSQQVENILSQSQEYLAPPGASAHVGILRGLTLLPKLIGLKKNPDGASLKEVLPADIYARWQPLKAKYLPRNNDVEQERPIFAAQALFDAGLKQAGLNKGQAVGAKLRGIVKEHNIKVTETAIALDTSGASQALSDFKNSSLADTECFTKTVSRLEQDLDGMRVRANAWAKGDLEGIQKLSYPDQESACDDAMMGAGFVKNQPGWQNLEQRIQDAWVIAAEKAISTNNTSFAVLGLGNILGSRNYLAALKAKGYQIDAPD